MGCWAQQELNSDPGRVCNWKQVFKLRPTIPSLTKGLPVKFTIYRAGDPSGMSWTLKKKTADWFANRMQLCGVWVPICERRIKRIEVLFYTNRRNEHEVVLAK